MIYRPIGQAVIEQLGRCHDDALMSFKSDAHAAKLIRRLPKWAAHWDGACWRVHPAYVTPVQAALVAAGFDVTVVDRRSAS